MNLQNSEIEILKTIDHAVLKPNLNLQQLEEAIGLAYLLPIASLCVHSFWVAHVASQDIGKTALSSVIGFPLGATPAPIKALEISWAIRTGASEMDVVINIGALKNGLLQDVKRELDIITSAVQLAEHPQKAKKVIKLILETCYLTQEEKKIAVELACNANIDFVKTSTGFGDYGATIEDVVYLRELLPDHIGVKASGGIKTLEDVQEMIAAGASRIGTSSTLRIVKELGIDLESLKEERKLYELLP